MIKKGAAALLLAAALSACGTGSGYYDPGYGSGYGNGGVVVVHHYHHYPVIIHHYTSRRH